jgi:hypothetical protein
MQWPAQNHKWTLLLCSRILRGYIEAVDNSKYKSCLKSETNARGFEVSRNFIRTEMREIGKSYTKITSSAGELPKDWEEQLERLCVRSSCCVRA